MKNENQKQKKDTELRNKAEGMLKLVEVPIENLTDEEVRNLAHELQVHQIELEMQNEELNKKQEELVESRDQYSHLYDFAPVGYFTISDGGVILKANLTGARMLCIERSLLIGKRLGEFITKEDQDAFYRQRYRVCKEGERVTCELRVVRTDGTQFYAQLECSSASDAEGGSTNCMTIMSDITERKEMEETLLQSEKLRSMGVITAGISHEFNNILSIISGNVQLMQAEYKGNSELMDTLCDIEKAVDKGVSITGMMRRFTHPRSENADYVSVNINEILTQSVKFTMPRWKDMAQASGVDFKMDMEGLKDDLSVRCNPLEIGDVFINMPRQ